MQCVLVRISAPISCLALILVSLTQTRAALGLKPLCLLWMYFLASRHIVSKLTRGCGRRFHFMTETTVIRSGPTWGHWKIDPKIYLCTYGPQWAKNRKFSQLLSHSTVPVPSQLITIIYVQGLICIRITPKHFGTGQLQGGRSEAMLILSSMKKQKLGGWKGVWRRK